jgi:hypothetical protein
VLWVVLAVAVVCFITLAVVIVAPVRLEVSIKGQDEFGKFWTVAMDGQLLFFTVSFAMAYGIDSVFQLHLFDRRLFRSSPVKRKGPTSEPASPSLEVMLQKARRLRREVERWFDLDDLLVFAVDLRHRVRMERLNGQLSYATPDLAMTGILLGSLYSFAGLFAPFGSFHIEPLWVDVAKASGNLELAFRFYPGRMVLDAIVFTFKKIKLRQRENTRSVPAPP